MRVDAERREAALVRLRALRATGAMTSAHVRLAAEGLGVAERTVWRWLGHDPQADGHQAEKPGRWYWLSEADREASAYYWGNIAAVARAAAVVVGLGSASHESEPRPTGAKQ